ncbi:hypothetical protein DP107_05370 [Haloglomus irregulare]|uniref:Uncharacterized protein n=1 Tax=Haloglomus irregulare TaxID=2234134 RepID=A0A554ND15_9EURY|nr:hypothetical protein DP107_05370 [Haloglomus irregulare]
MTSMPRPSSGSPVAPMPQAGLDGAGEAPLAGGRPPVDLVDGLDRERRTRDGGERPLEGLPQRPWSVSRAADSSTTSSRASPAVVQSSRAIASGSRSLA